MRDQDLCLLAREHRAESPLGILVDERTELAIGEHARCRLDQSLELRVAEQRARHGVDVVDGPLRELLPRVLREPDRAEQLDDVRRANVGELLVADHWKHVVLEPPQVVLPVLVGLLALLDPHVQREGAHGIDE
ncbi:MAG: hypothetical protein AB7T06_31375 [Kofleriaceae bacterium]